MNDVSHSPHRLHLSFGAGKSDGQIFGSSPFKGRIRGILKDVDNVDVSPETTTSTLAAALILAERSGVAKDEVRWWLLSRRKWSGDFGTYALVRSITIWKRRRRCPKDAKRQMVFMDIVISFKSDS